MGSLMNFNIDIPISKELKKASDYFHKETDKIVSFKYKLGKILGREIEFLGYDKEKKIIFRVL